MRTRKGNFQNGEKITDLDPTPLINSDHDDDGWLPVVGWDDLSGCLINRPPCQLASPPPSSDTPSHTYQWSTMLSKFSTILNGSGVSHVHQLIIESRGRWPFGKPLGTVPGQFDTRTI